MPRYALAVLSAACAAYFLWSTAGLPETVASHFVAGGRANAFMSRSDYFWFMGFMALLLPQLIGLVMGVLPRVLPPSLINVPHRDYWLAPQRLGETRRMLARQGRAFAAMMTVFLCFVHGLVVKANLSQPPVLDEKPFVVGLLAFFLAVCAWLGLFLSRFRVPD